MISIYFLKMVFIKTVFRECIINYAFLLRLFFQENNHLFIHRSRKKWGHSSFYNSLLVTKLFQGNWCTIQPVNKVLRALKGQQMTFQNIIQNVMWITQACGHSENSLSVSTSIDPSSQKKCRPAKRDVFLTGQVMSCWNWRSDFHWVTKIYFFQNGC